MRTKAGRLDIDGDRLRMCCWRQSSAGFRG